MLKAERPLILSIETATRAGSFALTRGEESIALRRGDASESHSNGLLQHVRDLLDEGECVLTDIDLFAVASGPGSFTGLRIGLATAKSFAVTLMRPCIGVQTLSAIASAAGKDFFTVAVLPAGRGEVFARLFEVDAVGNVSGLDDAAHITPQKLLSKYGQIRKLRWAGEGAQLHVAVIRDFAINSGISLREDFENLSHTGEMADDNWALAAPIDNLAIQVAALALRDFQVGDNFGPEALSAIYVRPSDAELKGRCPQ